MGSGCRRRDFVTLHNLHNNIIGLDYLPELNPTASLCYKDPAIGHIDTPLLVFIDLSLILSFLRR